MATLIGKGTSKKSEATSCPSARQFMNYFDEKVASAHLALGADYFLVAITCNTGRFYAIFSRRGHKYHNRSSNEVVHS